MNPDLPPSEPLKGDCNATDGFSVCTEPPGHGPTHWDRRTQHEWSDKEDTLMRPGARRTRSDLGRRAPPV